MTIKKNLDEGSGTIKLTPEEYQQFELGTPIIKQTPCRFGLVEVTVKKATTCPNGVTRAFLRDFSRQRGFRHDQTIGEVVTSHSWRSDQRDIRADLERFVQLIGGDIPVHEVMNG
jgi:hypothetical protein